MTIRDVAQFASELTIDLIPDLARTRARQGLRDTVATALVGATTSAARTAETAFGDDLGDFRVLAPGAPGRSATAAGFQSALAASALDFDDGHYQGGAIHPSSVIVPTILAAASNRPTSMKAVLEAQVAGFEVAVRLAHLLWPKDEVTDRWYCSGTAAAVGAAAGAAKVRGADEDGIRRAMQIAWAHAPMAALQWPMVKEAIGWSGATALTATKLAEAGFMRPTLGGDVADPAIFPATPFDEPGAMNDPFVDSWGTVFEIERSYLKPYPSCRYTHTALDALADQITQGLAAEQIDGITVRTHRWASFLDHKRPPSLEHAQYSYPFVLGTLLTHGTVGPAQMTAEALSNERVLAVAETIEVVHDPALDSHLPDKYPTQLELRLSDGRTIVCEPRIDARGDVELPMSESDQRAKFFSCVEPALGAEVARQLADGFDGDMDTAGLWALIGRSS